MTYKVTKELQIEMYESCKFFSKEARKYKDLRDQMKKLEDIFKNQMGAQAISEVIQMEKGLCVSYLSLFMTMIQSDIQKVVEQCVKTLKLILSGSTILSQIQPLELDSNYTVYKNIGNMLVIFLQKIQDSFAQKSVNMVADMIKSLLLYTNDIHLEDMKMIAISIVKLQIQFPLIKEVRQLSVVFINVLSEKYAILKSQNVQTPLPQPFNYSALECEVLYYSDYKSFIMTTLDQLSAIINLTTSQITTEQFNQQVGIAEVLQNFDRFCQIVCDNIYWVLKMVPVPALVDQPIKILIEKLYHKMIQFVIHCQNYSLQEWYLCNIEILFKTFMHQFNNQFIFEHFNNFILRIITTKEIPYYQLKASVCLHLVRLVCCDSASYTADEAKFSDYEYVQSIYKLVDYIQLTNCSEAEQTIYFQYIQRIFMPPGYILQLIYVNYDAQFTQPNLAFKLFKTIADTYQQTVEQPPLPFMLEKEMIMHKFYHKLLALYLQQNLKKFTQSSPFLTLFNKFGHACGVLEPNEGKFLNHEFENDYKLKSYRTNNYQTTLLHSLARLQTELSNAFLLFQYNSEEVKFEFDFGLIINEKITNTQLVDKINQKMKMEIGYNKFDEAPIKAMEHFRQIGFLTKLVEATSENKFNPDQELASAIQFSNDFDTALNEMIAANPDGPKRKKRNFQEEYQYNLGNVGKYLIQYSNIDECLTEMIEFVLKYSKKSEFSVGLSKAGFGELIGGSKIENKAILYYFVKYFSKKHLATPNVPFVQALRDFLGYFKLPGEGQVIDRIISFFSKAYSVNCSMDHQTIHGLAYAVIMLNTDLHNSSTKDSRMSRDVFVTNTKLIDYAKQLSKQMLEDIYDEILRNPFTLGSIEELKKFFLIMSKYVNIAEKKEGETPGQQNQSQSQEDDKETEIIKQMPKNLRYAKAYLEWIMYGSTAHNNEIQDSLLEKQEIQNIFSYELYACFVKQLGSEVIKKLLDSLKKFDRCANVQSALKLNLLLIFSEQLKNNKAAVEQIQLYISSSELLTIPTLQYKTFDISNIYEQIINKDTVNKRIKITTQNPSVLVKQQIELINFIIEVAHQRSYPSKLYTNCYSGKLQLTQAWYPIVEVLSRVKYYNILISKQIPRENRQLLVQNHQIAEYRSALTQDVNLAFQNQQQLTTQTIQNIINISTEFYNRDIFGISDHTIMNGVYLPKTEMEFLTQALAQASSIELEMLILPAYCLNCSTLLNNLLVHLIENDQDQFENCYSATFNHYQEIFVSKIPQIPENGFAGAAQVIGTFLSRQMRSIKTRDDAVKHVDNEQQIWLSIFSPLNLCLAPDSSGNLLWIVLEKTHGYLQYIEFDNAQQDNLLKLVYDDRTIDSNSYQEFCDVYFSCLKRCVLPRVTLQLTVKIINMAIDKLKQLGMSSLSKDVSLNLSAKQQNVKMDMKGPMSLAKNIVSYLSYVVIYLMFQPIENKLELSQTAVDLLKLYMNLVNNLRNQVVVADVSEDIQAHFFGFSRLLVKMLLKTYNVSVYKSDTILSTFSNTLGEILENICVDDRYSVKKIGQTQTRKLLTELLEVKYNRPVMQGMMRSILIDVFLGTFHRKSDVHLLTCDNLAQQKFTCECEFQSRHCMIELVVDVLLQQKDKVGQQLTRDVFSEVLKAVQMYHAPSLVNICKYLMDGLILSEPEFVLNLLMSSTLDNINYPDYVDILRKFMNDVQTNEQVILQTLQFCCEVHVKLSGQLDFVQLDQLFAHVITVFTKVNAKVQNDANVLKQMKAMLINFIPKFQNKQELTVFVLRFFQEMNDTLWITHFKKDMFNNILELIECNDAGVRKEVKTLLMKKNKPE
ncbi:Sec7_family protein [Hexamita inflata]|uniref:Sec7 family protein n=1 Tax=Hexamita inflata TaxID=28002 RepID=A0AA86U581_9EUKA|nr:Sec7 family protein [Hexamita inflata]